MSALCVIAAGKTTMIAATAFTLSWTHSVEKTEWRETWAVTDKGLVVTEASVKGSGAGMDPGEGAVLKDGWWVWRPKLPPVAHLALAASGATLSPWTLCAGDECLTLGVKLGETAMVAPCE